VVDRARRQVRNWLGNVRFQPEAVVQPASQSEVLELVKRARRERLRLRVMGAGHSWSPLCETDGLLLNLDRLDRLLSVDRERLQVTVQAGMRLEQLIAALAPHGLAPSNLGSIAAQSLAGAISTGTHGSGVSHGSLSTQVVALRLVDGRGEVQVIGPDDADRLDAARLSLGALGVITEVTLQVTPAFSLREELFPLPFEEAVEGLDELARGADHFKLWWFPHGRRVQVYRQHRAGAQLGQQQRGRFLAEDSPAAQVIFAGLLGAGVALPGLLPALHGFMDWMQFRAAERIDVSHKIFNLAMPPRHHESEYAVPMAQAAPALRALRARIQSERHRVNFVSEVRFVAGDSGWLSPCHGGPVCFIGGYSAGERHWPRYLADYEAVMCAHGGRPHWGKEFCLEASALRPLYPRWDDFCALRRQLDPDGVFLNSMLERLFVT
jgi:FAD-linked oxidoreductase